METRHIAIVVRGQVQDRFSPDYDAKYAVNKTPFVDDDLHLVRALEDSGFRVTPAGWSDPSVEWDTFDVVLFRSPWGFFFDRPRFFAWLEKLEQCGTLVLNSPEIIRANVSKFYLKRLSDAGLTIVPTHFVEENKKVDLEAVARERGWSEIVVKPASLGGAIDVVRAPAAKAATLQEMAECLLSQDDLLVQEYFPEIEEGEYSLIFFGSEYSHAVKKLPAPGEWREQAQYGGSDHPVELSAEVVDQAAKAREIVGAGAVYSRVDGFLREQRLYITECEMIDPRLFFGGAPGAAERLVREIVGRL